MTEKKKVIIVGELHQDIFYKTDYFSKLSETLTEKILHLLNEKKNDQQISKEEMKEKVVSFINDSQKKIPGDTYIKRGGNGNNSAVLINNLSIPTQLMTTIGSGHEWMIPEIEKMGIDTSTIYQVSDQGPISTIIEDPNITKIFVAPNLKKHMNFEKVQIRDEEFTDAKIVFFTPLADKYSKVLEQTSELDIISAVTIETQKIQNKTQLEEYYTRSSDILFANLNDLGMILGMDTSDNSDEAIKQRLQEIDEVFNHYAKVRAYTLGKYGSWICVSSGEDGSAGLEKNIPIIPVEVKNRTGAGDNFAAGFIAYLYEHIENKNDFDNLSNEDLFNLMVECGKYASAAGALKVSTGKSPNKGELEKFYQKSYQ